MDNVLDTTCVYYSDCNYCEEFDDDTGICAVCGSFVIDATNWILCPDFKCCVPYERCFGFCIEKPISQI